MTRRVKPGPDDYRTAALAAALVTGALALGAMVTAAAKGGSAMPELPSIRCCINAAMMLPPLA